MQKKPQKNKTNVPVCTAALEVDEATPISAESKPSAQPADVSKRIGIAMGVFTAPDDFDENAEEAAAMLM